MLIKQSKIFIFFFWVFFPLISIEEEKKLFFSTVREDKK
jgi:hypothetical protein